MPLGQCGGQRAALGESVLSFHHEGLVCWLQLISLEGKHLYLPSHPSDSLNVFYELTASTYSFINDTETVSAS